MSLIDNKTAEQGTIKVRRGNAILRVPADQKSYYMGLGYNVIGEDGKVVEETIPTDIGSLQRFYKDAKQQIAGLEDQIKSLKDEIKSLKTQTKPEAKEAKPKADFEEPVTSTRRRKKQ